MKSPKKFKFELEGIMFELPIKFLKKVDYKGNPLPKSKIEIDHVAGASVVKQYVKKRYPEVVVSSKSDSFSMGNSVNIYVSDELGNPIDTSIVKDINRFGSQFEYGKFNGMIDMYEHSDLEISTDNGTVIDAGVKYFHCNNRPKFGTVADTVRMLCDYQAGKYVGGARNLAESIKEILRYGITQSTIDKALKLI
jgi:hypothetical protein